MMKNKYISQNIINIKSNNMVFPGQSTT